MQFLGVDFGPSMASGSTGADKWSGTSGVQDSDAA